ncbi:hypothetical protein Mapa_014588 [Marchantia paleacea]|nr:hypothetical protein Mapa_014588 [Marchantia paleacea]
MLRSMCSEARHFLGPGIKMALRSQGRPSVRPWGPNELRCATSRCASHIAVSSEDPSCERYKHILKTGPHTFLGDLGQDWGAAGSAPEPKDYAFAALAMCTSMTVRLYADRRKWPLKHVQVTVVEKGGGHGLLPDGLQMVLQLDGDLTDAQKKISRSGGELVKSQTNSCRGFT